MWAFKQLWDKGLVYEGFRVLPTAGTTRRRSATTSCGWTTTSTRTARTRRSPWASADRRAGDAGPRSLIWTTTPWTLPSQPRHRSARHRLRGRVRRARPAGRSATSSPRPAQAAYAKELDRRGQGRRGALIGPTSSAAYLPMSPTSPPMSYYLGHENAFQVLVPADFVDHHRRHRRWCTWPGFGEDDNHRPRGDRGRGRRHRRLRHARWTSTRDCCFDANEVRPPEGADAPRRSMAQPGEIRR
jgi:isoleucyl-tRNA synthetase